MNATIKEIKQLKNILQNMKHYAFKNGCEFIKTKYDEMNLYPEQPKDLVQYVFIENGFELVFNVSFKEKLVYIEEFSEDDDYSPKQLSFKEFIRFQSYFLNNGLANQINKTTKENQYKYSSSLSIISGNGSSKDKKVYCNELIKKYGLKYGFKWKEYEFKKDNNIYKQSFDKYYFIRNDLKNTKYMAFAIYGFPVIYKVRDNIYKVLIKLRYKYIK